MSPAVTYGGELAATRRALTELRDTHQAGRPDHTATLAWLRLYRALFRHTLVLLGTDSDPLAAALTDVTTAHAAALHHSIGTGHTITTAAPPPLERAVDHLTAAADILFTHIDPDGAARSPAGIALLNGVDRDHTLAAIAELIVVATDSSKATTRDPAAPPYVTGMMNTLRAHAEHAAQRGNSTATYLTTLGPVLDVSGTHWPAVTSHTTFQLALLAARTWLAQQMTNGLTGQQLRQCLGGGLALSSELGFLAQHYRDDITTTLRSRHHTATWRAAYLTTENITTAGEAAKPAGLIALLNAEQWLRTHLRAHGNWITEGLPTPDSPTGNLWRNTAADLARSLPDIASMLHHSIRASTDNNLLYTLDTPVTSTILVREPVWHLATNHDPAIEQLITATREIRPAATLLTDILDVRPHAGISEAGRNPLRPNLNHDTTSTIDGPGTTAHLIRQLTRSITGTPSPLPPAAAALDARARDMSRRKHERTKISVPLARSVVTEIRTLTATIDQLRAEIAHLRTSATWSAADYVSLTPPAEDRAASPTEMEPRSAGRAQASHPDMS